MSQSSVPGCLTIALLALSAAPAYSAPPTAQNSAAASARAAPESPLSAVEYEQRKNRIVQFFEQ